MRTQCAILCRMPTRWVHLRVDEQIYDRMKAAAEADRRSLSNWVAVACERALVSSPQPEQATESGPAR
jgi:hypothetical protein